MKTTNFCYLAVEIDIFILSDNSTILPLYKFIMVVWYDTQVWTVIQQNSVSLLDDLQINFYMYSVNRFCTI